MMAVIFFLALAAVSLYVCHFHGSPDADDINAYDLVFAPLFGIAITGFAVSVLYLIVKWLTAVEAFV